METSESYPNSSSPVVLEVFLGLFYPISLSDVKGVAGALVGHPFDLVKVRMQTMIVKPVFFPFLLHLEVIRVSPGNVSSLYRVFGLRFKNSEIKWGLFLNRHVGLSHFTPSKVLGIYRGLLPVVSSTVPIFAINFGSYAAAKDFAVIFYSMNIGPVTQSFRNIWKVYPMNQVWRKYHLRLACRHWPLWYAEL
jgi:hypothetical protein